MYSVKYAADDLMPAGKDWLMCHQGGDVTLFIRASSRQWSDEDMSALLTEAWNGFAELAQQRAVLPPCPIAG